MASLFKEDERNERTIRGLLKLEPNRRCINCNSMGPQYVCTNFWTFVCTNCSGIHREFTHRVKSVSMAKFTSQEVSALKEGGNQRAREIYFKEWDAQRQSFPDCSNVNRLRDFIKHVYVDRRFTGDRTQDKPPRIKVGDKDDSYENRRVEAYTIGSKSPLYEDTHEHRFSDRSSPGGRSPGYGQESRQYGDYKKSPVRPPIINDWGRDDRRISGGDYKMESQSPERAKEADSSSLPVIRPVRDILGENVVPLRINEPPKPNSGKDSGGSALTKKTASSGSLVSSNEKSVDVKLETTRSLIDFDTDPEPTIPQAQQTILPQPVLQSGNSSDDNWASFDVALETKATPITSNINPLESLLSQLSVPASLPAHVAGVQGPIPEAAVYSSGAASAGGFSAFPPSGASVPSPGLATVSPLSNVGEWTRQSTDQQLQQSVGGAVNSQPWNVPSVPTGQGHQSTPIPHAYHHASKPEAIRGVFSQPSAVEVKPSGRNELPEDIFTVKHSSFPAPVLGWQMGLPQGIGITMQYNNTVLMPTFSQPSKSTNPFDVSGKPNPYQAPTFPSMSSVQGALPTPSGPTYLPSLGNPSHAWTPPLSSMHGVLPNLPPSGTMHPSSLGNPSHAWSPAPSSYASVLPPHVQTHSPALGPARPYMGQQMSTNLPMLRQEVGNFGTEGLSNPDQQLTGWPSTTSTSNHFPSGGGNPFS